jgi:electron transfer flavoprotein alpha subunit
MSSVLIIAEHAGGKLNPSTAKCVKAASALPGAEICVAVFCPPGAGVAAQAAQLSGVARVLEVTHDANEHALAATLAPQVADLVNSGAAPFTHVFGPSTTFGKDLMPRVAALLDAPQVSDIMAIESPTRFKRPIYAGNAITTVEVTAGVKIVATIRTASFEAASGGGNAKVETVSPKTTLPTHTRFVSLAAAGGDRPDLQSASRVISGGRALASSDAFKIIYGLADKIGAAVGASRAAVDAGYAPNDMQVGQTGKIIAPELYIAIGISGAIQHLTGIKDARTIVAINKDPEAPIFEVADIGIVGDLFTIVPELEKLIDASRK